MRADRVLLADGSPQVLSTFKQVLEEEGFRVVTAQDGLECVAQLRHFRPDVLIVEARLPWGSGEGVVARMYEDEDMPLVPVVLLAERHDLRAGRRLGCFPVSGQHPKDASPRSLVRALRLILRKQLRPAYGTTEALVE